MVMEKIICQMETYTMVSTTLDFLKEREYINGYLVNGMKETFGKVWNMEKVFGNKIGMISIQNITKDNISMIRDVEREY